MPRSSCVARTQNYWLCATASYSLHMVSRLTKRSNKFPSSTLEALAQLHEKDCDGTSIAKTGPLFRISWEKNGTTDISSVFPGELHKWHVLLPVNRYTSGFGNKTPPANDMFPDSCSTYSHFHLRSQKLDCCCWRPSLVYLPHHTCNGLWTSLYHPFKDLAVM